MRKTSHMVVVLSLLAMPLAAIGCGDEEGDSITPGEQTSQLESDLVQLREEEKLARDVYITLYAEWETELFDKISGSEQRHMDKVKVLLDAYGIADPITDDTVGVFQNATLAGLYTDLVQSGMQSELDALLVGATIEDLDIFDIREMRNNTDNSQVIDVYDSLECGSNNHMRAFTGKLSALGSEYAAQFLSAAEYAEILEAEHESCGGGGGGGGGH